MCHSIGSDTEHQQLSLVIGCCNTKAAYCVRCSRHDQLSYTWFQMVLQEVQSSKDRLGCAMIFDAAETGVSDTGKDQMQQELAELPACNCLAMALALRLLLLNTLEPSPKGQSLASATSSVSV